MNIDIRIKNASNRSSVINATPFSKPNEKKEHYGSTRLEQNGGKKNSELDHIFAADSVITRPSLKGQVQSDNLRRLKLPIEI